MAAAPPPPGAGPSGFPGNPMVINTWNPGSLAVAVWEWQDENNKWRPYSSVVSNYIEQCMQSSQLQKGPRGPGNSTSISLGHVDPHLAPYIIDVVTLTQFRQDTGTMRFVRKSLYPADSAPAKGVCWEWLNDEGYWSSYEMPITIFLEEAFCNRNQSADLQVLRLHYHVDFMNMVQTNKITGFLRRVQRRLDTPYPLTSKAAPVHKSAACACYQCLASSGAGPISTRNRHSMGNLPTSSNYQSASRTSLISSNNVGYLPYPKPTLTSAKSAPKLNSTWLPPSGSMPLPGPSTTNGIRIPSVPVHLQTHSLTQSAFAGGPVEPEQVVKKYLENVEKPSDEDCIICMETLNTASGYATESRTIKPAAVGKLKTCGHVFHQLCMLAMYNNGNKDGSLQCPACKTIYGEKTGTQPKGKMEIFLIPQSLPGHQDCETIHIVYMINPGIQSPEHPTPGKPYSARGFPRHCYLPDNTKGRLVLELLKLAWSRRLIFTIGVSSTTGESDTVVWNEIHHKTEMISNITGHGYPDPNYLDNVIAELAAQGVTEEGLNM